VLKLFDNESNMVSLVTLSYASCMEIHITMLRGELNAKVCEHYETLDLKQVIRKNSVCKFNENREWHLHY
jgi:hypothetical protein